MLMKSNVTPQDAVTFLNELLVLDRVAVERLVENRVPCNDALAQHPTVQVGVDPSGETTVGILGVLNGLFGVSDAEDVVGHDALVAEGDTICLCGSRVSDHERCPVCGSPGSFHIDHFRVAGFPVSRTARIAARVARRT